MSPEGVWNLDTALHHSSFLNIVFCRLWSFLNVCLWGVSPGCHPQDFKSPFSTPRLSVISLILQVSPGLLPLVLWLDQSPNTQSQGSRYSLRLASWGPSSESQKPVEAANATVVTSKLPPLVCSIIPRTRHGPEKSNVPHSHRGASLSSGWRDLPWSFFLLFPFAVAGHRAV